MHEIEYLELKNRLDFLRIIEKEFKYAVTIDTIIKNYESRMKELSKSIDHDKLSRLF